MAALLLQAAPMQGDEIVVVARRRRCDVSIAERIVSDRDFRARAAEWAAGRPVSVIVPPGSSLACEEQVMMRLVRAGVTRARFVER